MIAFSPTNSVEPTQKMRIHSVRKKNDPISLFLWVWWNGRLDELLLPGGSENVLTSGDTVLFCTIFFRKKLFFQIRENIELLPNICVCLCVEFPTTEQVP